MIQTQLDVLSLEKQVKFVKANNNILVKDKQHLNFQELLRDQNINIQTERSASKKVKS